MELQADSYLGVYDSAGLLGSKSVLAHCVHMKVAFRAKIPQLERFEGLSPDSGLGCPVRRWHTLKGFHLKATARIWP